MQIRILPDVSSKWNVSRSLLAGLNVVENFTFPTFSRHHSNFPTDLFEIRGPVKFPNIGKNTDTFNWNIVRARKVGRKNFDIVESGNPRNPEHGATKNFWPVVASNKRGRENFERKGGEVVRSGARSGDTRAISSRSRRVFEIIPGTLSDDK